MPKLNFGKHAGKDIKEVPTGYLTWMVEKEIKNYNDAKEELIRRKKSSVPCELTNKAIDMASVNMLDKFLERENLKEGIATFFSKLALEIIEQGAEMEDGIFGKDHIFVMTNKNTINPVVYSIWENQHISTDKYEAEEIPDSEDPTGQYSNKSDEINDSLPF